MDFDMFQGMLLLVLGLVLVALIPLGLYLVVAKRSNKKLFWSGIASIIVGVLSAPLWLPLIAMTFLIVSGGSFS
jgi:hypothetical protein